VSGTGNATDAAAAQSVLPSAATAMAGPLASLELALEVGGLASWEWNSRTEALTWSTGMPEMLAVPNASATHIERLVRDLVAPVLVAARAEPAALEWDLQQPWRRPQRAERWLHVRARAVASPSGDTSLAGVIADVTHRRAAEPVDEVSNLYRLLVELSPDGILLHQDGRLVYANPAGARMVGVDDPDRLIGDAMMDYVALADRAALMARVAAMRETDTYSEQADMTLVGRRGQSVEVSSRSVRTTWQGRPAYQVILRDLTDSRTAHATLRYQASLLEQVSDAIISTDLDHIITSWNPGAEKLFGWSADEVLGRGLPRVLEGLSSRRAARFTKVLKHRNGRELEVQATITELKSGAGEASGYITICSDESGRRQAERDRQAADERYATAVSALEEGVLVLDAEGVVETANPAATRLLRVGSNGLLGRSLHEAVALFDDQGEQLSQSAYPGWQARASGRPDRRVFLTVGGPGQDHTWITVGANPLPQSAPGKPYPVVVSFSDTTQARNAADKLYKEARLDPLTRLPNRTLVLEHLDHALDRIKKTQNLAVLFIDLDRFKVVNDSLGHEAGDDVLRAVSERLCDVVGKHDLVGRLSGDEFVVVTRWAGETQIRKLAHHIAVSIEQPITTQGRNVVVRSSIGIASTAESPSTSGDLLRDADVAMYRAKQTGRNRSVIFDAQLRRRAVERLELEEDLRQALSEDQLWVAYQPILRIEGLGLVGAEALARWTHPARGDVSPEAFIPLAEDAGLIDDVFDQVLRKACQQAAVWRQDERNSAVSVSVNLSAQQLSDAQLVSKIRHALHRNRLSPSGLTLELTESALMEDAEAATVALSAVKEIGVQLSMDDFGTGYSSLSYLRRFPVEIIKIDRSFITGICEDTEARAIVSSIIQLADSLGRRVVAEGVETAQQLEVLAELKCDYVQGYHLSRPLTATAFSSFAAEVLPPLLPDPRKAIKQRSKLRR